MTGEYVLDHASDRRGSLEDWVAGFAARWAAPGGAAEPLVDLLSPDVRLVGPGGRPVVGRAAALDLFRRTFRALPDLAATVRRWGAAGDALFVELTFSATVGGRRVTWDHVDRFLFEDGRAVERVAYFDPAPVRRAGLRSVRGLLQLRRLRA